MEKLFIRALSLLLVLVMTISPLTVFAEGAQDEEEEVVAQAVEEVEEDEEETAEEVVIVEEEEEEEEVQEPVVEETEDEEPVVEETEAAAEETVPETTVPETTVPEETAATEPTEEAAKPALKKEGVTEEITVEAAGKKYTDGTVEWYIYEEGDGPEVTDVIDNHLDVGAVLEIRGTGAVTAFPSAFDIKLLKNVKTLTFGDGITSIDDGLFNGLPQLEFINIGLGVTSIADGAFVNNYNLRGISVSPKNTVYMSEEDILYKRTAAGLDTKPGTLMLFPARKSMGTYEIPATVTAIADFAMDGCSGVTAVTFAGSKVASIGEYAFRNSGLKSFTVPAKVTAIPASCFEGSADLKSVFLHNGITTIGNYAFKGTGLTSVDIPASVTAIPKQAFANSKLESIYLHDAITSVGEAAFAGCKNLEIVELRPSFDTIPQDCFNGCTSLRKIIIPKSITKIDTDAFKGCTGLDKNEVDYGGNKTGWLSINFTTGNEELENLPITFGMSIEYDTKGGQNDKRNPNTVKKMALPITLQYPTYPAKSPYTEVPYEFEGWYKVSDPKVKVTKITADDYDETTPLQLYAKWIAVKFDIEYALNGGTNHKDNPSTYDVDHQVTASSLKAPTRKGYTFGGWYLESTFKTPYAEDANRTGLLRLHAKWEAKKYTVDLNPKNGEPSFQKEYTIDDTLALPTPTRKGYKFEGWYDKEKGDKDAVQWQNIPRGTNKSLVLYAHWSLRSYSIEFHARGGKLSSALPDHYFVTSEIDLTDYSKYPKPSRTGYTFGGWFLDDDYAKPIQKIEKGTTGNMEIFPKWTPKTYTITFNSKGGNHQDDITYTIEKGVTLPKCKRAGYTFKGWYSGTTKVTKYPTGTTGNKSLKAKWSLNKYTITYKLNGGKNSVRNPSTIDVTKTRTLKNPTRKGYDFKGWFLDSSYKVYLEGSKLEKVTENVKLYAKWSLHTYTVSFDTRGGNAVADRTYTIKSGTSLPKPTREGYTFQGWYKEKSYINKVTSVKGSTAANLKLYAKWSVTKYTVSYQLNGGKNHVDNPSSFSHNAGLSVSDLKNPARKGYTFLGWYRNADFTTPFTSAPKANIKLYAKWQINKYTVTFNTNGGNTIEPLEYTVKTSTKLPTPTKSGYEFGGWYKKASLKGKITKIEEGTTGNMTLYAKWNAKKFTITYKLDGGKLPATAKTSYKTGSTVTFPKPTKKGYTFDGWWSSSTKATGNKVASTQDFSLGNITVYAKWTKK